VVAINPASFAETDEVEPIQLVRVCVGSIAVMHRDDDPRARVVELDALGAVVANALNGVCLAEESLPRMTTVAAGIYGPPEHPSQTLRLELRFARFVELDDGRDEE